MLKTINKVLKTINNNKWIIKIKGINKVNAICAMKLTSNLSTLFSKTILNMFFASIV